MTADSDTYTNVCSVKVLWNVLTWFSFVCKSREVIMKVSFGAMGFSGLKFQVTAVVTLEKLHTKYHIKSTQVLGEFCLSSVHKAL